MMILWVTKYNKDLFTNTDKLPPSPVTYICHCEQKHFFTQPQLSLEYTYFKHTARSDHTSQTMSRMSEIYKALKKKILSQQETWTFWARVIQNQINIARITHIFH